MSDSRRWCASPAAFALAATGFLASLGAARPAGAADTSGLEVTVTTDRLGYLPGQPVEIEVRVTNNGSEPFTMGFNTACQSFFIVEELTTLTAIYDFRRHVTCPAVVTTLHLEPGQSESYFFTWTQVDDAGQPAPAGAVYRVRGFLGFPEPVAEGSTFIGIDRACSDGRDNDGDGLIDFPADPGCAGELDRDERDLFGTVAVGVRTDRQSYPPGDTTFIDLLVTNVSSEAVTLTFSCVDVETQVGFDVLTLEGERIFSSPGSICLPATGHLTLQPGQTEIYYFSWFQEDVSGAPVPSPSQWIVRGWVDSEIPVPDDRVTIQVGYACSDGLDNDFDGATDYPDDTGCVWEMDTDETGTLTLRIDARGLAWDPVSEALAYDVVQGDLLELARTGGDFASALRACMADDHTETALEIPGVPAPGGGWWFVARTVHAGGNGSYDSGHPSQVGLRDAEINSSFRYCP